MSYRILLLTTCLLSLASSAKGAITFALVSGNLVMTVDQPIVIPMTGVPAAQGIIINLENVYSINGTAIKTTTPTTAYASGIQVTMGIQSATSYGASGQRSTTAGIRDPDDFYVAFNFGSTPTGSAGTVFTIQPGSITLAGSNMPALPDFAVTTIQLTDANNTILSNPITVVPEPSAVALGVIGALAIFRRRRID